jgi:hypothetical protein
MPGIVILPFDTGAYSAPTRCILGGITSPTANTGWALTAGDQLSLVLYPRTVSPTSGAPTTTARLPVGGSIIVVGKQTTALDAATLLFSATDFAESNDGSGDAGNWLYTGTLNLNTEELAAAIPTGVLSIPVMLVLDVIDAEGNAQRFLAAITVFNECYAGSEGAPTPATPEFLTALQTAALYAQLAPAQGSYRVKTEEDGTVNLQYYNATTGLFHTFYPSGETGSIMGNWGVGEA